MSLKYNGFPRFRPPKIWLKNHSQNRGGEFLVRLWIASSFTESCGGIGTFVQLDPKITPLTFVSQSGG
jgi:hypothetical protein